MAKATNKESCKIRVIAVYREIIIGKPINTKEILRRLKQKYGIVADRKTIYSDVAAINRFIPIKITAGPKGGYSIHDVIGEAENG